jgi:hypothetical protein
MIRFKRILKWVILLLYAVTWVGGWISHARQLRAETEARYRAVAREFQAFEAAARRAGREVPSSARVNENGPTSGVAWCVPILPGVLLTESGSSIGPLSGSGSVKLVLYYGVGSVVLSSWTTWLA